MGSVLLDIDIISRYFQTLSGEGELANWMDLLQLCRKEVEGMMKTDADERTMPGLCYAAAALANYRFNLKASAGGISTFKAGDVSVSMDDTVNTAKAIYADALRAVSGLLDRRDFAFICV